MPIAAYSSLGAALCGRGSGLGGQSSKRMELEEEVTDLVHPGSQVP